MQKYYLKAPNSYFNVKWIFRAFSFLPCFIKKSLISSKTKKINLIVIIFIPRFSRSLAMRNYKKFSNEELLILEKSFKTCSFYPDREKIKKLARSLKTSSSKIDNWFKYKRRKMYYCGKFSQYKIRKIFSKRENDFLNVIFARNQKPSYQKCKEISLQLPGITTYQVKNWFSNRRRKLRNDLSKKDRRKPGVPQSKFQAIRPTKPGTHPPRLKEKGIPLENTIEKENKKAAESKSEIKSVKVENNSTEKSKTEVILPIKVEPREVLKTFEPGFFGATSQKKEPMGEASNGQMIWPGSQMLNFPGYIFPLKIRKLFFD